MGDDSDDLRTRLSALVEAEKAFRSANDNRTENPDNFASEEVKLSVEVTVRELKYDVRAAELKQLGDQGMKTGETLFDLAANALEDARVRRDTARASLDKFTKSGSAAPQGQAQVIVKRLKPATLNDEAVPGFMRRVLDLDPSGTVLELGAKLWKKRLTSKIVVRACYEQYATPILAWLDDPAGGEVLVAGTKGIGKSVFGLFLILRMLRAGKIVIYHHRGARMMLIGPEVTAKSKIPIVDMLKDFGYSTEIDSGVFRFMENDKDLFEALIMAEGLTHVLDLDGENPPPLNTNGESRKVVISSPNSERLSKFISFNGKLKVFYLPLWTLDEIKQHANALCVPPDFNLDERFAIFGGVIQYAVDFPQASLDWLLRQALGEATPDDISYCLDRAFASLPKSSVRGLLIHTVPLEDNINDSKNVFASNWVVRTLLSRFRKDNAFQLKAFIEGCSRLRATSAMRGLFLEQSVHEAMIKGGATFTLADLEARSPLFAAMAPLPALAQVEFEGPSLEALKRDFKPLEYALPLAPNFEAIDAFAVIPRASFVKKAKGMCLAMFQVAVARTHDVTASGLRRVFEGVLERLSDPLKLEVKTSPVYLVFVKDKTGVFEKQPIKYQGDEKELEFKVHQLILSAASIAKELAVLFNSE